MQSNKFVRDSNMELLRIIAMLGILAVHADFFALGIPSQQDCVNDRFVSLCRFIVESITIVSVNIFVLLSGWYGIHPKIKRIKEFIFQILFFNILFFVFFSFTKPEATFSKQGLLSVLMLDKRFWFVKAYLMLYLLSPILNAFIDHSTKRQLYLLTVVFFIFQTLYGWLFTAVSWFNNGYSALSFVGLYLIARYFRLSGFNYMNRFRAILLFILFVVANSILAYFLAINGRGGLIKLLYAYNSPFVIVASLVAFYFFTTLSFKSRIINALAISSFAAFLLHANHFFLDIIFVPTIKNWFANLSLLSFSFYVTSFILCLFFAAIVIDKFRSYIYNKINL